MRQSTSSNKDLVAAKAVAKKVLENIDSPRIRDLLANGLLFSQGGASTQAVVTTYAPILAELGVDFVLQHMHNSIDKDARDLAHKLLRDIVGHGVKLGITDAILADSEEERQNGVTRFQELRDVLKLASAQKVSFEDALAMVGREIKPENAVLVENNPLTDEKE